MEIKIGFQNAEGFPRKGVNQHKMREFERRMKDKQAYVIIESGCNKNNKLTDLTDNLEITTINYMNDINNSQY